MLEPFCGLCERVLTVAGQGGMRITTAISHQGRDKPAGHLAYTEKGATMSTPLQGR